MGGITDEQRGICDPPPSAGLENPDFQAALLQQMQRIARMDGPTATGVRHELWTDIEEGWGGGDASSIARSMLAGRRQFDSDQERLLYLRFTLQMELEGDRQDLYHRGYASDPNRIADAMLNEVLGSMRASVDQVTPLPNRSFLQPAPAPGQMDVRGISEDWGELAARSDRSDYEAYLSEVVLLQAEEASKEHHITEYLSGPASTDLYQSYVGVPFKTMVNRGIEAVPQVVSLVLDFTPIVGQLKAVAEGAIGTDVITGRNLETWERGLGVLLAVIPEARGIFRTGRAGLRRLAGEALKSAKSADEVFRVAKVASEMSEADVAAAREIVNGRPANPREFEKVAGKIAEMTGSASRGYRIAAGVIEDGRTVSKSIASLPVKAATRAPGKVIKATKTADRIVQDLTKASIDPKAIAAMERAGINITDDVAKLVTTDPKLGAFVNSFHECPGFESVFKEAIGKGSKNKGARFVVEFVMDAANNINPKFAKFEQAVGKTKSFRRGVVVDVAGRVTDLVVTEGNRVINYEFKAGGKTAVARFFQDQAKVVQLVKDVKMLGRENIRWVFDSREVSRDFIYAQFERAVKSDVVLAHEFGDAGRLEAALDDLVVMFPPDVPRLGLPASAPVKAAGAAEGPQGTQQ